MGKVISLRESLLEEFKHLCKKEQELQYQIGKIIKRKNRLIPKIIKLNEFKFKSENLKDE